jgi:hypothetical protein
VLLAYSGVGVAFFVFTFQFVFQRLVMTVAGSYPDAVRGLWAAATAAPFHPLALGPALLSVAWRTLILIGTLKFTYNFLRHVVSMLAGLAGAVRAVWREVRPRFAAAVNR